MKTLFTFFAVAFLLLSCAKQEMPEQEADKWNGYSKYLKSGEQVHTLWAGKNINVGTVTYGLDDNGNFYATYDCSASGWTICQTHLFAGDKLDMPLSKPGRPKIGQFPYSGDNTPGVSSFTYYIPLTTLPPCEEPGFVVAAHCCVHSPSNQQESAWAEGDYKFTDKGWGWYDVYYFNQPVYEYTILYGTSYTSDSLNLYHIDVTNGEVDKILTEFVGSTDGTYDGVAYDVETGTLLFTKNTDELWVNILTDEDPSFFSGYLSGEASSATYLNGVFYYVDDVTNNIYSLTLNPDWTIATETLLDQVPGTVTINDIAMDPDGDMIYMVGEVNDGGTELITWDMTTETFYSTSITVNPGAQIAYGSDGLLYALAPIMEGGSYSVVYLIDTSTGTATIIDDEVIIIDDPFSDMASGPIM
jgi:hypothetical protein